VLHFWNQRTYACKITKVRVICGRSPQTGQKNMQKINSLCLGVEPSFRAVVDVGDYDRRVY